MERNSNVYGGVVRVDRLLVASARTEARGMFVNDKFPVKFNASHPHGESHCILP
jgi:hypothetical protein